ncbi:MAG TPA: CHAT domain-containing protein [Thermoanaerobaculia bacterium]|nr:CHAT domain-containing protein [Thermoanaerobaculia bacterium]
MRTSPRPVVLFAFANNRMDPALYLRNLPEEQRRVREAMTAAEQSGLCEIVERANATAAEVLDVFLDSRYGDRVAIFHFGGHAGSGALLFESPEGAPRIAHAAGLARFLGEQRGLALVFLNGCSTQGQVQGLLAAGVPVVIATSQAILDSAATELSARFYQALASGAPLRAAFEEATAAVQALTGDLPQGTYAELDLGPLVPLVQDRWPWVLYVAPGAEEEVRRWSLPRVVRDPLFGLPPLPAMDLPLSPFKHLAPFTREDAPVFFGRGREIRELYEEVTRPEGAPLVLLFGATGAGKSSLLAAGLLPRLEASHEVLYLRRDRAFGLAGTLARALGDEDAMAAWRRKEATGKPLAVILDQAEEAWIRPLAGGGEVEAFAAVLRALFAVRETRPRGRLVLGFRKEWLAEVLQLLDAEKLFYTRVKVAHLDRDAIEEVVLGAASSDRLRRHYRLEVDPELPARIANDLAGQGAATIAPILQILLTQMWMQVQAGPAAPRFTLELYERMKRRGLLLNDFLEEQLRALREQRPEAVDSGLVLDLLFFHTTPLGTAEARLEAEVAERYRHLPEVPELVGQCKDRYLVAEGGEDGAAEAADRPTRLAHDTLAPLVRQRFESSDLPGQRAQRILLRAEEWTGGRSGEPLGELDLARVEEGKEGMRVRTHDEERLIEASHIQVERWRRQRRSLQFAAVAAVAVILGAAALFLWLWQQARASEERSHDRAYAALGANLLVDHPTEASLVALEVRQPDSTPTADDLLEKTLLNPVQTATLGHTEVVWKASFSPDGTRVVTAFGDKTARIWNVANGQPIATLTGHTGQVFAVSFSPDGARVLTASRDKTARIWNAATGQSIATLTGHTDAVFAASFSPDGTRVVTASEDKTARIWNTETGQLIATLTGHTAAVRTASFSPDGTRVVTASWDQTARIWNAETGQPIATLTGHTGPVMAVFSPDGTRVVTASYDQTARIWNAETGQPIATMAGHTTAVFAASFSPDGTRVVTASADWTARIWNAETGQPIATMTGHTAAVEAASFSPDGTRVVTASKDKTARIWNATTGQPIATLTGHTGPVMATSFSPDGTRVVTASADKTVRIWNAATGQPIATIMGRTTAVRVASFSPDGTRVVTASLDWPARIWKAATGQPITTLTGHTCPVMAASFSPDSTRVVTASADKTARVWNAATGQPMATLAGHTAAVEAASFSPDGTRVVTVSGDRTARIWRAATGQPIATLTGHTDAVLTASFSPNGTRVVTASKDNTARIWNAATGRPIATLTGHTDAVLTASFSPDGTRVVTASKDNTARIWKAATGQLIASLTGHSLWVQTASFSPDSTRVVTASLDRTARIWDAVTGQPIAALTGHTDAVLAASFSPDGTRVVTASADKTARIWPVAAEYVQSLIRARTLLCLSVPFRQQTLAETPQEAESHEKACQVCVPKFFARLKGVPISDAQTHIAVWRAYRGCLDRAR